MLKVVLLDFGVGVGACLVGCAARAPLPLIVRFLELDAVVADVVPRSARLLDFCVCGPLCAENPLGTNSREAMLRAMLFELPPA